MNYKGLIVISFILMILSLAAVSASELNQSAISTRSYDGSILADDAVTDSSCDESLVIDDDVPELPSDDSYIDDDEGTTVDNDDDPINSDINDGDSIIINITNDTPKSKGNDAPISNVKAEQGSFEELQGIIDSLPAKTVLYLYKDYKGSEDHQLNINKDLTIDGQGHTLDCDKKCRAIHSSSGYVKLMNINFINGYFNSPSAKGINNGGAICIEGTAQYVIENCLFDSNWADDYGGAIYNSGDYSLTVRNCIFKNNDADDFYGGAISSLSPVLIYDSIFENNHGDEGGAIHTSTNRICEIHDCKFNSNTAKQSGGAIFMGCESYIYNSTFSYNFAKNSGGAIFSYIDTYVENCLFEYNKADGNIISDSNGGAIYEYFGNLTITGSTFNSNYADDEGGAIYAQHNVYINHKQSDNQAHNTFFNGNIADDNNGGAIKYLGNAVIKNAAFSSNKAYHDGGAIFISADSYFTHCLFNSNQCLGSSSQCKGGAIYTKADITFTDCIFQNNYAEDDGGAVYSENTVNGNNCTFSGNSAKDYGGAIYAKTINVNKNQKSGKTHFTNNKALDNNGGAIYVIENADVFNAIFNSNSALVDGGAIFSNNNVNVQGCTFDSNQANGAKSASCYGGAIRTDGVTVIDSTFKNNLAENQGGAIYANIVNLISGTFDGNKASKSNGGAIYTNYFLNNVKNTVFYNNYAKEDGGAIYINKENSITFSQCTFVINHAGDEGGAIYLDSTDSYLQLINNLFLGNNADDGYIVFNKGSYGTIYNNWWGDKNPSYDIPMLVEWKFWSSNENKIDSDPLRIALKTDKSVAIVGETISATLYFVKSDGSVFTGEMPTAAMAFILPDTFKTQMRIFGPNSVTAYFVVEKTGTYNFIGNLYGQFAIATITIFNHTPNSMKINENGAFPGLMKGHDLIGHYSKFNPIDKSITATQSAIDLDIFSNIFISINSLICSLI